MISAWKKVAVWSFLLLFALPGVAFAHVTVSPERAQPGAIKEFTAVVPTEKDVPTTGVRLEVPEGFEVVGVGSPGGGWRGVVENGAVAWSGGEIGAGNMEITSPEGEVIPMGESEEFTFKARTPQEPGSYAWPTTQTYDDGSAVEWSGPTDSEAPAPTVEVVASGPENAPANAGDHDHNPGAAHEHSPGAGDHEHPPNGAREAAASSGGPSPPFVLAGVGVVVASAATVGAAFLRNKNRPPSTRPGERRRR